MGMFLFLSPKGPGLLRPLPQPHFFLLKGFCRLPGVDPLVLGNVARTASEKISSRGARLGLLPVHSYEGLVLPGFTSPLNSPRLRQHLPGELSRRPSPLSLRS